jgi:hypothetical protein
MTLALIAFGFGLLACMAAMLPAAILFRSLHRASPKAAGLRVLVYGYAVLSGAWAAYWCLLMLQTCWLLVAKDGGPGPFGLLVLPFWAALAVVPAATGIGLLRLLHR